MAEKLISIVSTAPVDQYRKKNDDDFSDRLSSKYTVAVLVVFALVVGMTQYVGKPIVCWTPAHFHGSWIKFTNSYCWVKNTYYLPWENVVPFEEDHEGESYKEHIQYYQWIPFILIGQAILFYLPTVVWHAFNSRGGVDADSILESAHTLSVTQKADNREKTLKAICNAIHTFLATRKRQPGCECNMRSVLSVTLCRPCGRRFGNYLVLLFIFSKVCYLANAIGQFFLLDLVLGKRFTMYGFDVMKYGLAESHNWEQNEHVAFPRVTMCDLNVKRLGNVNRYSVQCVLPINLYNEKIYLFLWFWMVMVVIVSAVNFVVWITRFLFRGDRLKFVYNHLKQYGLVKTERDKEMMKRFLDSYLKQDGAFLLRLIAHNTNNITVTEIACGLWDTWQQNLNKSIRDDDTSESSLQKRPISLDASDDDTSGNPDDPEKPIHDLDSPDGEKV